MKFRIFSPKFFLLLFSIKTQIHAQYVQDYNNNNYNYGGDYNYNDNNGNYRPNSYYNGYWSSNGNGYGYGYYPGHIQTNCLYNYVPPYMTSYLDPGFSRLLSNLSPADLQSLINTPYTADQPFLAQLQAKNPQLYNQIYSAYSGLDPTVQQNLQTLMASVVGAVQQFASSLNGQGGAQSTPLLNQNFPKIANFMRGPGMNAFARQPNPFISNVPLSPIASAAGVVPQQPNNPALPNAISPLQQIPQIQQPGQILPPSNSPPSLAIGGIGGLLDGISHTVSSAVGMLTNSRKKK